MGERAKPDDGFAEFWAAYPRKIGRKAALKAWQHADDRPPLADILAAIERAKASAAWRKDNGQFIPHPSTWLNQGRWADEAGPTTPGHDGDPGSGAYDYRAPTDDELALLYPDAKKGDAA